MAKLRKAVAYRNLERPYTRRSKYSKKNFVRASPNSKVIRYDMGTQGRDYSAKVELISTKDIQIRHNSIEAARLTGNRYLDNNVGKANYHLKIRFYPHHILRENPLASGAGADRMSTGMKKSFGKPIGLAARIKKGQTLMTLKVDKTHIPQAKLALKRASYKLPCTCSIKLRE